MAAFVAPMDGPVLRDAAIVFVGDSILAVGDAATLRADHPDAIVEDLGNTILLPGLVNAHAHLELSDCDPIEPLGNATFTDWIVQLRPRLRVGERTIEEAAAAGVARGVAQCLRFGTTTIGDISQQHDVTRPLLRDGPLRVVSYGEALGLAGARPRFERLLSTATATSQASDWLRIGLSPHAPYTVDLAGYCQCLQLARTHRFPLATHLAETPDEEAFLSDQSGPFRAVWERLGAWADGVETFPDTPIRFAHAIGLLAHPTLLAHVNYCDDGELSLLAAGRASVVYCPRTHAYFGHPPHRWRQMLAAGINVAVGTDSCASSPDLNLVDDLRLLHRVAPEVSPLDLWRMATVQAAMALEMADTIGSLTAGNRADIVGFAANGDEPLREILEGDHLPTAVWIGGTRQERGR
jgi:cytosine/adenosine deaminase-related metal-dependent hydrolase